MRSDASLNIEGIVCGATCWIAPDEARGSVPPIAHPYVVVQDDVFNASRLNTAIVCGITSNMKRVADAGTVLLDEHSWGCEGVPIQYQRTDRPPQ